MTGDKLIANAERMQRQGRIGDAIRLRILAAEIKTVRYSDTALP